MVVIGLHVNWSVLNVCVSKCKPYLWCVVLGGGAITPRGPARACSPGSLPHSRHAHVEAPGRLLPKLHPLSSAVAHATPLPFPPPTALYLP